MLRTSVFDDPLANWPNEDMLVLQENRDKLRDTRPELLRILDWEELRAAFSYHDELAARNKRWSHFQGIAAIVLSGFGVILLGLSSALSSAVQAIAAPVALAAMFLGGLTGLAHFVLLQSKHHWLGHRFWAERLRQLKYQSLVGAFGLASQAMSDDQALEELKRARAIWLADNYTDASDPRERIRLVEMDRTEQRCWLEAIWKNPPAPAENDAADKLLDGLYRLRIEIQRIYASRNLGTDLYSAPLRHRLLSFTVKASSLLASLAAGIGLVAVLQKGTVLGATGAHWTIIAGIVSAIGLIAQSLNGGLQAQADLERYEWYKEEMEGCRQQFEEGGRLDKLKALRRLEEAAYSELRAFLRTHGAARFIS